MVIEERNFRLRSPFVGNVVHQTRTDKGKEKLNTAKRKKVG
jgi:hypothetical protein